MLNQDQKRLIPVASLVWLAVAVVLFLLGTFTFSLHDQQIWPTLTVEEADNVTPPPNTVILNLGGGDFSYDGSIERLSDANLDEFFARFDDSRIIVDLEAVEMARIFTLLQPEADPDAVLDVIELEEPPVVETLQALFITLERDASSRPLLDEADGIRQVLETIPRLAAGATDEDEVRDDQFILLLDERANPDALSTRFGNVAGVRSVVAQDVQRIVAVMSADDDVEGFVQANTARESVEAVRSESFSRLQVTHTEGANVGRVSSRVSEELNAYFPIAGLSINLWLPTVEGSSNTVLRIRAVDSGIPLYMLAIFFALVELVGTFYFRSSGDDKLIRPILRALGAFFLFWSVFGHEPFWDFVLAQLFPRNVQFTSVSSGARVVNFVGQHLELVIISSLITIPLGLALGILVTREQFREFLPLVNTVVNIGQTIPTLAILAIMVPILRGTGFWPAVIALVAYGLLPIVRNTVVGLESVPASTIDAAKGMGLTPTQILVQIELPIASRVILAGVRTSTIVNIGTATLGAFVGAGGLGFPIQSGISMINYPFVFLGALPAALLALLVDYVLGRVEYAITPRGLQIER